MPALVVVAIIVIAGASIFSHSLAENNTQVDPVNSPIPTEEVNNTTIPNPTNTTSPSPLPTVKVNPTANPIQTISDDSWQYPGSVKIGAGSFESQTSDASITEWYEQRIRDNGYNAKSFVKTSTNGEINNKLVASGADKDITVSITKSRNSSIVKISISHSK